MAGESRGKNSGQPITWGRYLGGMLFLTGYHAAVQACLLAAGIVSPRLRELGAFHRDFAGRVLREALAREGIVFSSDRAGGS
jgi:hypothetical protein